MPIESDSVSLLDWGSRYFSKKEAGALVHVFCCFLLSHWNTLQLQLRYLKLLLPIVHLDIVAYAFVGQNSNKWSIIYSAFAKYMSYAKDYSLTFKLWNK